jgi:hypothetical protein
MDRVVTVLLTLGDFGARSRPLPGSFRPPKAGPTNLDVPFSDVISSDSYPSSVSVSWAEVAVRESGN